MHSCDRSASASARRWLEAAARNSAVRKVIANVRFEDQKQEDRRMQKESDERAQRLRGAR